VSLPDSASGSGAARSRLILGVDGGGSKTAALVASVDETGHMQILGRGIKFETCW